MAEPGDARTGLGLMQQLRRCAIHWRYRFCVQLHSRRRKTAAAPQHRAGTLEQRSRFATSLQCAAAMRGRSLPLSSAGNRQTATVGPHRRGNSGYGQRRERRPASAGNDAMVARLRRNPQGQRNAANCARVEAPLEGSARVSPRRRSGGAEHQGNNAYGQTRHEVTRQTHAHQHGTASTTRQRRNASHQQQQDANGRAAETR